MTVNVLGTEYTATIKKYDEDPYFAKANVQAYCCGPWRHEIVVGDLESHKEWDLGTPEKNDQATRQLLRHEIVHAFLAESGLDCQAIEINGSWAVNEEMVDWIAIQGPKIYKAWQEADAL